MSEAQHGSCVPGERPPTCQDCLGYHELSLYGKAHFRDLPKDFFNDGAKAMFQTCVGLKQWKHVNHCIY